MSMNFKKLSTLLITTLMVFSLTACGSSTTKTETNAKVTNRPVTLTLLGAANSKDITTGLQTTRIFKELKKRTGITLDFTPSLGVQDVDQKISVLMASDDLPDIVVSTNATLLPKILTAKAALPLDALLKTNGKDLAKNAEHAIKVSRLTSSDDSKNLFVLHNQSNDDGKGDLYGISNTWVVRWDLYKKLGMPKISNYDDLLKLGQDMVKLEPTSKNGKPNYAFGSFLGESWGYLLLTKPADQYSAIKSYHIDAGLDIATDKAVPYITDPSNEFWAETKAMNKAYQMGIFDPESATLKFQNFMDKAKTGRYMIGMCDWMLGGASAQFQADGHPEKGYMPLVVGNTKPNSFFSEAAIDGNQWMTFISKNSKNPDRAMDLLNYLSTPAGIELMTMGIEGTDWTAKDGYVNVPASIIDAQKKDADYNRKQGLNILTIMPIAQHGIKDPRGFVIDRNPEDIIKDAPQFVKNYCADNNVKYPAETLMKLTGTHYNYWNSIFSNVTLPPASDLANNSAKINAYIPNAITVAVFQKTDAGFDAQKEKIIKAIKDMGSDQIVDYYNKQYVIAKAALAVVK